MYGDEAIEGAGNDVSSGQTIDGIGIALIGGALALIEWTGGNEEGRDNLFIGRLQCGH